MYSYKQICTASCVHALGNSTNIIHSALFKAAVCLNLSCIQVTDKHEWEPSKQKGQYEHSHHFSNIYVYFIPVMTVPPWYIFMYSITYIKEYLLFE